MTLPADPSPWVGEFPGLAPWPGVDDFKPAMAFTAPAPPPFNSSQKEAIVAEGYKLTVSLKGKTQSDPWLVVNASTPKELHELLEGVHAEGVHTAIGRAQSDYTTGLLMGSKLDARTVSVEKVEEAEPEKEPAKPAAKKPATRKPATAKKAEPEEAPKAEAEESPEEPKPAKVARPAPGSGAPRPKWAR